MIPDFKPIDRGYRRGAIMGLTVAEAFILIAFLLLLLFAFWQQEAQKENTEDVQAFKGLPTEQQELILRSMNDGSLQTFAALKKDGVDFDRLEGFSNSEERWRFIDSDELSRIIDAVAELPEDIQRDLADLVEVELALPALRQIAALQELVKIGESIDSLNERIQRLGETVADREATIAEQSGQLTEAEQIAEMLREQVGNLEGSIAGREATIAEKSRKLAEARQRIDALYGRIRRLKDLLSQKETEAEQALQGIEGKIRAGEERERELTRALETELGELVGRVGGQIDESGAIILPNSAIFDRGEADITPQLRQFLEEACTPWLAVLKNSGVPISEIKIEGHASSEWRGDSSPRGSYLGNLGLSQRRSQAVLRTCLDFVSDPEMLEWARRHLIAVGYSSVRPVMRDGEEDLAASRRVVFSVAPSRDALIRAIEDQIR